jgi:putative transposase
MLWNQRLGARRCFLWQVRVTPCYKGGCVLEFVLSIIAVIRVFCQSRSDIAMEVLALRQQVVVLKRKRPRPTLNSWDRLFWTTLRHLWSHWSDVLVIVKPETVVAWHRAGFRLYWRWRSRPRRGRARITEEVRTLIRRLAEENPDWGAPRIHGELRKLGFVVSERTVARYLRCVQRRGDPGKQWLAFLQNHREVIAACDFFTVPTVTFRLLYCFFIIEHERRKILHFNITRHPTAAWVVQQLREAFPEVSPYRYVILDHDSKFDAEVITFLKATGLEPKRTSIQSPWQKWHRRTLGRKLPPRHPRPRDRAERTPYAPAVA